MKNSGCRQSCRELRRTKRCGESDLSSETLAGTAWDDAGPSGAPRCTAGDLKREGTNMLRLAEAYQQAQNPLSASSRQARTVLGQF